MICKLIEKKFIIPKHTLTFSCSQGIVLNTLVLFYAAITNKEELMKYDRNTTVFDKTFRKAKIQFFTFLRAELTHSLTTYSPTKVDTHEAIQRKIQLLIDDFYHRGDIGAPDQECLLGSDLVQVDDKETTAFTWAETNPLAAMRWYVSA